MMSDRGEVVEKSIVDANRLPGLLQRAIADIDHHISRQVTAIVRAEAFKRLEAAWRSLRMLVDTAGDFEHVQVRMLSARWSDVARDLTRAVDYDRSALFDKIYSGELDLPGGTPFGLLVGEYEVRHRPTSKPEHPLEEVGLLQESNRTHSEHAVDDVEVLGRLAELGAAAFCPIVLGLAPSVLQLDNFRDLASQRELTTAMKGAEYARWRALQARDDSRFLAVALPRFLLRGPRSAAPEPALCGSHGPGALDGFMFQETTARGGDRCLWGNAAFAFAAVVIRAFGRSGWMADIRGAPLDRIAGGIVPDLPADGFGTDRRGVAQRPPVECILTQDQARDLSEFGMMPLQSVPFTEHAAFYSTPSIYVPRNPSLNRGVSHAALSGQLQYVLCVSRFAHYIRILARESVGRWTTAEDCEKYINRWLRDYLEGTDSATPEAKARRPLREGKVVVRETPGRVGAFTAQITLKPHHQLDTLTEAFRLSTYIRSGSVA